MSSPFIQTLTANPLIYVRHATPFLLPFPNLSFCFPNIPSQAYLRRLASRASSSSTDEADTTSASNVDPAPAHLRELVRLQSAHLPGFNPAVSSSLRAGPVTGMKWAFESAGWKGRRVLVIHVSASVLC
jgi:hypothetical protein